MCRPDTQPALLNESLTEMLGGESQLDFLLMTMCENMQDDEDLSFLFKAMDLESMQAVMKSLMTTAFERNIFDDTVRNGLILKSFCLFERGFHMEHFQKLESHLESAMLDAWVEPKVLDDCKNRFSTLRSIFEEEGKDLGQSALAHRVDFAKRILAPKAA